MGRCGYPSFRSKNAETVSTNRQKSDGRVQLWDANKKIEKEFMETQDLLIIGLEGWRKLAATPLNWKKSLPSALIIKNTTT